MISPNDELNMLVLSCTSVSISSVFTTVNNTVMCSGFGCQLPASNNNVRKFVRSLVRSIGNHKQFGCVEANCCGTQLYRPSIHA